MRLVTVLIAVGLFVGAFAGQMGRDGVYRLQPEDVLQILMRDDTQVNLSVPVGPDGNISAPFVGTLKAAGHTTSELEDALNKLYADKLGLRTPRVSVTIIRYRALKATVGGFVQRPSVYEIRPGDTLLTLLNQGGGPVPNSADLHRATLRHANSRELIPVDLESLLLRGDTSQNYSIQDGDELTVPRLKKETVLVQGAIQRPGAYTFQDAMTLADAVSLAGGEIRYRSMFSKTMVIRPIEGQPGKYLRIQADFVRFIRNGDSTQNILLQPGDLVYIPENKAPDVQQIASTVNALFFFDQFYRNGIFGLRIR